jgi:hypothetical protein
MNKFRSAIMKKRILYALLLAGAIAHISLYGRGAWEFEYVKDIDNLNKMPGPLGEPLD